MYTRSACVEELVCLPCNPSQFGPRAKGIYECSDCEVTKPFGDFDVTDQKYIVGGHKKDARCKECRAKPKPKPEYAKPKRCDQCHKEEPLDQFKMTERTDKSLPSGKKRVYAAACHGCMCSQETPTGQVPTGQEAPGKYRCSVCEDDRAAAELYEDGANLAWKSSDGKRMRTEYWCLACAFPTCASCEIKTKTAVKRSLDVFVDLTSREWYL
jgi:hypothetical protein